ncbi:cobyric acid synthase [Streptomyces sp. SL13]|uniref:Cobyric acid synthase n=1 Tax=Streptantibioticus silvisoli TaxID=2705255 RepID=A0AA90H539_9ACTN|nr:cobyric acid synthase [Streptantibioticus silvisoli]MDI5966629.1 cobyric acid synthase [Streptantibioticus silvisoli]MDI5970819.1 cobyric acid synthase [Streptantibioticus silvisoli]
MKGSLLVAGASSDAGKSMLTAGICRWLHRRGVDVVPFKAQNMSNNSAVTHDGAEIGRAQQLQAHACGARASADMNPVLLKPGGDRHTHVVLHGKPLGEVSALDYRELKTTLRQAVLDSYDRLRAAHDVVICEGAGSPAEINLRETDVANMWLADQRDLATLVVGDIDRGGVFAALFGTLALLDERDQSLVAAFVVNKFRGDERLVAPGLRMLHDLTGRQVLGALPWLPGLVIDGEDSLSLVRTLSGGPPVGEEPLHVAAVRLPRTSNATDLDALGCEPGVVVQWTTSPAEVAAADLAVLPGSRATVSDLEWLRATGLADAVTERARRGRPVLGVCGGYQMLAETITDDVESRTGTVPGLALLPTRVRFDAAKTLGRPTGHAGGITVDTAYAIHHGVAEPTGACEEFLGGWRRGSVWGTPWHGCLDTDAFRRAFLREVADAAGRRFTPAPGTDVAALRDRQLDLLADAVADHLDTGALDRLITAGPPAGLPTVRTLLTREATA